MDEALSYVRGCGTLPVELAAEFVRCWVRAAVVKRLGQRFSTSEKIVQNSDRIGYINLPVIVCVGCIKTLGRFAPCEKRLKQKHRIRYVELVVRVRIATFEKRLHLAPGADHAHRYEPRADSYLAAALCRLAFTFGQHERTRR